MQLYTLLYIRGAGCPRGALPGGSSRAGAGCPRGARPGGSSRAGAGCPRGVRPNIHSRPPRRAHATLPSAVGHSLLNRSCKESLLDAIALIINYLCVPLGVAFTG